MTDAYYLIVVEMLNKRFAKPSVIQHAHINQLIIVTSILNENEVSELVTFWDEVQANFWVSKQWMST